MNEIITNHWLLIAAVLTLFAFGTTVLGYLTRRYWQLLKESKTDREHYSSALRKLTAQHTSANRKLMRCVQQNTLALENCKLLLYFFRENLIEDARGRAPSQRSQTPSSTPRPGPRIWQAPPEAKKPQPQSQPQSQPSKKLIVLFKNAEPNPTQEKTPNNPSAHTGT